MKLTHIAQALTLALLVVTAWLAFQATEEARRANDKMDRLTGRMASAVATAADAAVQSVGSMVPAPATVAPSASVVSAPAPSPTPVTPEPPAAPSSASAGSPEPEPTAAALARAGNPQAAVAPAAPAPAAPGGPAPLTPLQKRVLEAPSLGKIADVVPQHGFVAFKVPEGTGLKPGMKFDLRRNSAVVGRITVASIEPDAVVADLDPKSVPAGVSVQVGDEVISIIMTN